MTPTIKSYQSKIDKLQEEINLLNSDLTRKIKAIKQLREKKARLENNDELKVSEHAIVRYFERVKGYDLEQVKRDILSDEVLKMIQTLGGSGKYPNKNFKLVMDNNTVVTII